MLQPISPTPPPLTSGVVASQRWSDVAFVHWPVPAARIAPLLPPGVEPDTFAGSSWAGLIAFQLSGATLGPRVRFGTWGAFTEVNVRLYGVDAEGRRGVVFRSLEASSLPAVLAARAAFALPYTWAATGHRATADGEEYAYASRRRGGGPGFRMRMAIDQGTVEAGGLAEFLTARWGLFQRGWGRTWWLPNAHEPWELQPAQLVGLRDELMAAAGLPGVADAPPTSVLFSRGVTARFGRPHPLGRARG